MLVLSLIAQGVLLLGVILWSVTWTIRARDSVQGVVGGALWFYGLTIVWSFLFSVVIPVVLVRAGADRHAVVESFPEAICNVPVVLFGWGPALIIAVLARVAHRVVKSIRAKPDAAS